MVSPVKLVYFSLLWIIALYFVNSLFAQKLKRIDARQAAAYISSVMLLGVFGEVLMDSFYALLFGRPLWVYHLLPIHYAYTSYYSLFIWGMYGFHLYLLHDTLHGRIERTLPLAWLICAEALLLEIVFNATSLLVFGQYIFYYLPQDLWHLTSIQVIPVYLLAGVLVVRLVRSVRTDTWFFSAVHATLLFIFVFLST
ncbi:MAG TPA: hypothetical protein VHD38_00260 [Candidatus Paceibacterota bacterium]|nr:hypothetical protein [Candidatus Paceibacterota bacterium]